MTARPAPLHSVSWRVGLLVLLLSALWGGIVVAVKLGLTTFPPLWSAFWRCVAAAPVIGLWARWEKIRLRPSGDETGYLAALGIVMFVQVWMVNSSVNLTSAAFAVILLNTGPIFINLFSHFFIPGDRLTWARVLGLSIAFTGICIVFLGKPDATLASRPVLGNVLAMAASALLGARMVATKRVVQRIDTTRAVFWQVVVSAPFFLTAAALLEPAVLQPVSWTPVLSILYQGIVPGGICFIIWVRLLRDHPPGVLSVFAFPTPIFGLVFSALIFSEALVPELIAGVALLVAGIVIVARQPVGPQRQESPPEQESVRKAA